MTEHHDRHPGRAEDTVRRHARRSRVLAAIGGAALVVGPTAPALAGPNDVEPGFTCAAANSDGSYTYFFTYSNPTATTEVIAGGQNKVTPASVGAVPPTSFAPGTHAAFTVTTTRSSVSWRLADSTVTASSSTVCTGQPIVAEALSPYLLPVAAIVPFAVWFVRNRRRSGVTPT